MTKWKSLSGLACRPGQGLPGLVNWFIAIQEEKCPCQEGTVSAETEFHSKIYARHCLVAEGMITTQLLETF
jgi:hypothetical protein